MGRIVLFNSDLNSADSIQHLIEAGLVEVFDCHTFPQFLAHKDRIRPTLKEGDIVVIDTYTSLIDLCRMNAKLGTERTGDDWEKRNLYLGGDKGFLAVYNYATDITMAHIADFRGTGCSLVVLAHEDEERDPLTLVLKRGPRANKAAVDALLRKSSDVMRLTVQQDDERDDKGAVKVAAGTRLLYLRNNDEMIAKVHVRRDLDGKLPRGIKDPTMPKIRSILQKTPSWLTIYGAGGAGKTTLATSDAQVTYESQQQEKPAATKGKK
jgi:hypothetical protein